MSDGSIVQKNPRLHIIVSVYFHGKSTMVGLGIFQLVDSKTILMVEMLSTNSIHISNAQT